MLLVAGFTLAVALVITTVMLNDILFEANTAREPTSDPALYDLANLIQLTITETQQAYQNNTNTPSMNLNSISSDLSKYFAYNGEGVKIKWNVSKVASLTESGLPGGGEWTVVENVENVTSLIFKVSIPGNESAARFSMEIKEAPWTIIVEADGATVTNVTNGTGKEVCGNNTIDCGVNASSPFKIDVLNLSNLQFFENVAGKGPYSITFSSTGNVTGWYRIEGNYTSGRRFQRSRGYVVNTTIAFSTSSLRFNATIPVPVPGDADEV